MSDCPLLRAARDFREHGLSAIPVRPANKKPAIRWKPYQSRLPDDAELGVWFADVDTHQLGIAIVGGAVSQGLAIADFDVKGSYERWARSHANLAHSLPTVATPRGGWHVWFRCEGLRTCKTSYGDLKAEGGYVLAPPSERYAWLIPFTALPPLLDPVDAGLLSKQAADRQQEQQHTETSLCVTPAGAAELVLPLEIRIERAIEITLPKTLRTRHHKLWPLIRRLKGIAELADKSAHEVLPILLPWFDRALPYIGTKDFADTQREFLDGWQRVRKPIVPHDLRWALERAIVSGAPPEAKRLEPQLRLLAAICRELAKDEQRLPPPNFFLACRDAAALLGIDGKKSYVTAWHKLRQLCEPDVALLRQTASGSFRGLANEYRYLGEL